MYIFTMAYQNNHFIDDCFQEKSLKIIEIIFENGEHLTREEVVPEFKRLWDTIIAPSSEQPISNTKKRCIMLNKNGKRCSFKINKSHKTHVCTFHFNKNKIRDKIEQDFFSEFENLSISN